VEGIEYVLIGDIGPSTDWSKAFTGVSAVVHLAGRAHVTDETGSESESEHERVNTEGTRRLASEAVRAGVRRLVFLSTVKVHGERTDSRPFREDDLPCPSGPYAVSKWKAEEALAEISRDKGLAVVIIRPPLVYGPGVGANFLRLLRLVDRGIPLPLGGIANRRSLIGVGNLVAMIITCLHHPNATGQTFLVSDGHDMSTPQLINKIASSLQRRCLLLPAPEFCLKFLGSVFGRGDTIGRLVDSLQVEIRKAQAMLGWTPPFSVDEELNRTARWYKGIQDRS
jgi:UDP-glucose 4-epimerase